VREQRRILVDLGQRLSSFFGADHILWVEGPTEEAVFDLVLREFDPDLLSGLRILHVADTGSFGLKDVARTANIYRRLGNGVALIPPTVGFLFDREARTEEQRRDYETTAGKPVRLLARKMVENYFLSYEAIAAVISEDLQTSTIGSEIEAFVADQYDRNRRFEAKAHPSVDRDVWARDVHAAHLLTAIFTQFSEMGLEYSKTNHGPRIAERILASDRALLEPLAKEVADMLRSAAEWQNVERD